MKRVILPLLLLGLTMNAMAGADLTSARIYRNQGDLAKAISFFNQEIEKSPDSYTAIFERGEVYGMIAMDNPTDGRAPTEASLKPFELFASQAAAAIEIAANSHIINAYQSFYMVDMIDTISNSRQRFWVFFA